MRNAILISGRGSTLQALLDVSASLRVSLVVSSKKSAEGLTKARRLGIPTLVFNPKDGYEALDAELRQRGIRRIFLAGFMKIIPADFIHKWAGRIINIHPSVLPLFPGLKAFENSYKKNEMLGATLHQVTAELDGGPILRQFHFQRKGDALPSLEAAQLRLSFCEQRLVREVLKVWN